MAVTDGPQAVLTAVKQRLADDPHRVMPTLRLLADPDALAEEADDASISLARTLNAHRIVALLRELRARSYTTAQVSELLGGVSRQAVSLRVANGRLMSVEISRRSYFPEWQFGSLGVLDGVPRVVAALTAGGRDVLAADALMLTPLDEEDGRTPADLLAAGDVDRALHYIRVAGGGF
jgi:hypothetical protein